MHDFQCNRGSNTLRFLHAQLKLAGGGGATLITLLLCRNPESCSRITLLLCRNPKAINDRDVSSAVECVCIEATSYKIKEDFGEIPRISAFFFFLLLF